MYEECSKLPFSYFRLEDCLSDVRDKIYERIIHSHHMLGTMIQIRTWKIATLYVREI